MANKLFLAGALAFCLSNASLAADEHISVHQDYTLSDRAALIGLNFLFGTGSYISGHIWDGIMLTSLEVCGITLVSLPFIMEIDRNSSRVTASLIIGSIFLVSDVIFNIIYPLSYYKLRPKTAELQDLSNWNAVFLSQDNGKVAVRISFTAHLQKAGVKPKRQLAAHF